MAGEVAAFARDLATAIEAFDSCAGCPRHVVDSHTVLCDELRSFANGHGLPQWRAWYARTMRLAKHHDRFHNHSDSAAALRDVARSIRSHYTR